MVSACRDVQQWFAHAQLPSPETPPVCHSSSSGTPPGEQEPSLAHPGMSETLSLPLFWLHRAHRLAGNDRDQGRAASRGVHPPHSSQGASTAGTESILHYPQHRGSWQEGGGAEGTQQSLHCVYSTCLKHEAKPFLHGLADVCSILTTVAAAGGRPGTLRKAPGQSPCSSSCTGAKSQHSLAGAALLHTKMCCKSTGMCQQKETVLAELLAAALQEHEPSCLSCPETPQLLNSSDVPCVMARALSTSPEGSRGP